MRICVYGAGAIGGYIGAMLARSGVEVTLIARGAHLAAIRANGLRLHRNDETLHVHPRATDDPVEAGEQDYVIVALKTQAVPDVADRMRPLFGRDTAVLIAANGIPWWYFHRHGGEFDGRRLASVDPCGRQWDLIGPARALGAVLWQAGQIEAPGVVRHTFGDRMPLGEPDGSSSARIETLSAVLTAAGIAAPVMPDIRNEIWVKLWGNLSFNPVSVLTGGTLGQLVADPGTSAVIRAMMAEAQAVAERLGIRFPMTVEERLQAATRAGSHKTSMLQDFEQGRSLEIEALVGAVIELGRLVDVATPTIGTVYDLVAGKTRIQDQTR